MKIYIAAPLFNEGERAFNEKVDDILRACCHETFLPQRAPEVVLRSEEELREFFRNNR